MLEDIRTYARLQLGISGGVVRDAGTGMTRDQYIAAVRSYAIDKHGDSQDVKMHAERTARHLWASRKVNG